KIRLIGLWSLSLVASVAVGVLLIQLYRQSTQAQVGHAEAVIARACDRIQDRYGFYTAGWTNQATEPSEAAGADQRLRSDLATVTTLALAHEDGVEGGIWRSGSGPLAYAYPTYQGTGPKTDLPAAERAEIQAVNENAVRAEQPVDHQVASRTQTLLLHACPLSGPIGGLTAWAMTRVQSSPGLRPLQFGFGILFALMVAMSGWLGRTLFVWGRHVRAIEAALARAGEDGMPAVPRTGERELDRIIDALNEAGRRLAKARQEQDQMSIRVARAERLAGLGRVAAGVAHEIRNPIAAARLQGENALAGDDNRRRQAIIDMLEQIDRLDVHVAELLAMTQRVDPHPVHVDLAAFLSEQTARHKETAAARQLAVTVEPAEGTACLDPAVIGRVLDNLLTNAIRHAPLGGAVRVAAERNSDGLTLTVEDSGPGVPSDMRDRLFEPFVTGRADGTGLGLAIARELANAHQGRLELRPPAPGRGAVFALTLPREDAWRAS
ncbi:MAG: hypothetical protein QOH05_3075, partial [Acetobacteraceae bacterium]|nr:hypothetical protein [Acetobacteraceae bacterium]